MKEQLKKILSKQYVKYLIGICALTIVVVLAAASLILGPTKNKISLNSNNSITNIPTVTYTPEVVFTNNSGSDQTYSDPNFDINFVVPDGWQVIYDKMPSADSGYKQPCDDLKKNGFLKQNAPCDGDKYVDDITIKSTKAENTHLTLMGILTGIGGPDSHINRIFSRDFESSGEKKTINEIYEFNVGEEPYSYDYKYLFINADISEDYKNAAVIKPGNKSDWLRLDSTGFALGDNELEQIINILASVKGN